MALHSSHSSNLGQLALKGLNQARGLFMLLYTRSVLLDVHCAAALRRLMHDNLCAIDLTQSVYGHGD